jgi:uncharacterized protein (TIGR03083 family)
MAPDQPAPYPDVRPVLPAERAAFVDLLAGLTDGEWDSPTECPAWSVTGVALHILGDDLSLLSRQRDAAPPGLFGYAEDHPGLDFRGLLDGFNEQWVRAASFLSRPLVLELLRLTGEWSAAYYDGVDPEGPSEPVGFFAAIGPSPFWQVYGREYVERWVHHHQVRRAVGRPDLGVEFLVPAVEVATRGLAAHLPGLDAAAGTTLTLTIPTVGVWALSRDAEAWVVGRGAEGSDDADVDLRIAPGAATSVFSRALGRAEVESAFTASGDPALAASALTAVARMCGGR